MGLESGSVNPKAQDVGIRGVGARLRASWAPVLLVLGYAALIGWLASHHEMWRDEVRALDIVRASHSLAELFANLRNEGHPALWYLVLYAFGSLTSSSLVLPLCSAAIAVAAVALFVARAPFRPLEKTLFAFGYFPLYEYSVVSRNYGIGMLLLFCFCALQTNRGADSSGALQRPLGADLLHRNGLRRRVASGCVLLLLANTSALGATVAIALLLSQVVEYAIARFGAGAGARRNEWHGVVTATLLGALGVALAVAQMTPDETSLVTQPGAYGPGHVALSVWRALRSQGAFAQHLFSYRVHIPATAVLIPCYLYLARRPSVLVFLLSAVLGMELVDRLVYPLQHLRHQGFLLLAILAAIWLARSRPPEILRNAPPLPRLGARLGRAALVGLLVLQVDAGFAIARQELRSARSSGRAFAHFLEAHPAYRNAILISEPDYYAETLPYYIDNRIYVPRERSFSRIVSFTRRSARELSLSELLGSAEQLSRAHGVPVLILWGHPFWEPGVYAYSFGRKMIISPEGLRAFEEATVLLQRFDAATGDENYAVYAYRPKAGRAPSGRE